MPPALTLTFSSDFASWISFEISVEMSRLASVTRRPMVGSVSWTGWVAMRIPFALVGRRSRSRPYNAASVSQRRVGSPAVSREVWSARRRRPGLACDGHVRSLIDSGHPMNVAKRPRFFFPELDRGESTFLGDFLRRETVGGTIALVAAAIAVVWANSPLSDGVRRLPAVPARPAGHGALGGRRCADALLLRGGAGAQARVRGRVAAQAGRRGRPGRRRGLRSRRTGADLLRHQRLLARRRRPAAGRSRPRPTSPSPWPCWRSSAATCRPRCGPSC